MDMKVCYHIQKRPPPDLKSSSLKCVLYEFLFLCSLYVHSLEILESICVLLNSYARNCQRREE
jgi:hypothetical protein